MLRPKYVSRIQDGTIVTSQGRWPRTFANDAELVREVEALIDGAFAFVDEPAGWPPAAILRALQEKRVLRRPFTAITWRGPRDFATFEVAPS